VRIRAKTEADHDAVAEVTAAAVGKQDEARLVEAIRASEEFVPQLTRVAEDEGRIVGHVMYSYSTLDGSDARLLQLSPLSVAPDRQGEGIGSTLTRESLREWRATRARPGPSDLLPALRLPACVDARAPRPQPRVAGRRVHGRPADCL